jgi:nucleotide-binding universal stress UspA family protein
VVHRIVVAVDDSSEAEAALRVAMEMAARVPAELTVLHVMATIPTLAGGGSATPNFPVDQEMGPEERFRDRIENLSRQSATPMKSSIAHGFPPIEICRFAEDAEADLIVLGRKRHCTRSRLLLGDTADAVARRSRVPTLFVPMGGARPRRILVALDGSPRGMRVLEEACGFAQALHAEVQVLSVEQVPVRQLFRDGSSHPGGASLQASVSDILARKGMPDRTVISRRGYVAEEVLAQLAECGCDVLAIGHHRGEPSWAVQAGSTAQKLSHAAPCAVLTIPL